MSIWVSILTIINTALSPSKVGLDNNKSNAFRQANASAEHETDKTQTPITVSQPCPLGTKINIEDSVKYLNKNARELNDIPLEERGRCATLVREALEHANLNLEGHPRPAKDYGKCLKGLGFIPIDKKNYAPKSGDVIVINGFKKEGHGDKVLKDHPDGHIQMYNGKIWLSDFIQKEDIWPGPDYRIVKPDYEIYRMP